MMMLNLSSSRNSVLPLQNHYFFFVLLVLLATATTSSSSSNNNGNSNSNVEVVLDQKSMKLTLTAAELSLLAYESNPSVDGFDMMKSFIDEPFQTLVTKKDGYCYGVFRGATLVTPNNWSQTSALLSSEICGSDRVLENDNDNSAHDNNNNNDNDRPAVCCTVRTEFYDAYYTNYYQDFEKAIRRCSMDCINPDECIILTGHSQGGAVATIAAIILADLNPYVFTYGQPPTLAPGCPFIATERWYRWVNSRTSHQLGGSSSITYDPVPFTPGRGTECWGHFLVLGDDTKGVAYLGLDNHTNLEPTDGTFKSHFMKTNHNATDSTMGGYIDRIVTLMKHSTNTTLSELQKADGKVKEERSAPLKGSKKKYISKPIPTDGFCNGSLCSIDAECASGKCKGENGLSRTRCTANECNEDQDCDYNNCNNGECTPTSGSCQPCAENSDCKSGKCLAFRCTGPGQLMDENCGCFSNEDCRSGRCKGVNPRRICEALLPMDARCNADADCMSGYCSWSLRCADLSESRRQIKVQKSVFNWFTIIFVVMLVCLCIAGKYALERFCDFQRGYEEIPGEH